MKYYRSTIEVKHKYEIDPSYTIAVNNNGNIEYPLKGTYLAGFEKNNFFNLPIIIGNNVTNCSALCRDCYNFNQPIIIPENVTNCSNMLKGCSNYGSTIKIYNSTVNCVGMLVDTSGGFRRKSVYCTNLTTAETVYPGLDWTTMTNGVYNASQNLYLYTNLI